MAIKKTKILDLQSITGIATVGIFTAGGLQQLMLELLELLM